MSPILHPLISFLKVIPDKIHTSLLTRIGGQLMSEQAIMSRLDFIEGKRIKITIKDTENCWKFIIRNNRLVDDMKSEMVSDVHIQGDLNTFLLLASGHEDPDSLFFSRKLSLEGNTEDGLYIKNLMDAMEFDEVVFLKSIFGQTLADRLVMLIKKLEVRKNIYDFSGHFLTSQ